MKGCLLEQRRTEEDEVGVPGIVGLKLHMYLDFRGVGTWPYLFVLSPAQPKFIIIIISSPPAMSPILEYLTATLHSVAHSDRIDWKLSVLGFSTAIWTFESYLTSVPPAHPPSEPTQPDLLDLSP